MVGKGKEHDTCISRSCNSDQDCNKFLGHKVLGYDDADTDVEEGDLVCRQGMCKAICKKK